MASNQPVIMAGGKILTNCWTDGDGVIHAVPRYNTPLDGEVFYDDINHTIISVNRSSGDDTGYYVKLKCRPDGALEVIDEGRLDPDVPRPDSPVLLPSTHTDERD